MSGFDAGKVNTEFFSDGKWRVNLICNLGYGDVDKLFPQFHAWSSRKPLGFCKLWRSHPFRLKVECDPA